MRRALLGAALVGVCLAGPASAADAPVDAPAVAAQTEQPRAYGHVIGDLLTQRVLLEQGGRALDVAPAALPPADRTGLWFERRAPRVEVDAEGRRWLAIDYQLINAPRALTSTTLPALTLATSAGVALAVPAWPLTIGPLTAGPLSPPDAAAPGGLPALQPDRPVEPRPTRAIERQLQAALAALGVVLVVWLAWWGWRQWRESRRLPFAHAWSRLRRLDAADPAAWLALHEAINQSAGRVVHAASLARLVDDAPQLRPLHGELARFFEASNGRFFGSAAATAFPLHELGRALRAAEKRHAR